MTDKPKLGNAFTKSMAVHLAGIKSDQGRTMASIARDMGIPGSYLSAIKNGDKEVTPMFVEKWCDWLYENDGGISNNQRRAWHSLGAMSRGWKL